MIIYDTIYFEDGNDYQSATEEMKSVFPNAIFNDESDFIHEYRFSIELDVDIREYRLQLLKLGLALCSLNFQLFMKQEQEECRNLISEWKKEQ